MNSNNLEKQKEKILVLFKENKFKEVILEGKHLLLERQNDTQLIYIIGLSSINLQDFNNAEKFFLKLISLNKNYENYYILGNIQKKLKKFNEAIISYEEAVKLNQNFSEAYNNLGSTLKTLGKYKEAIINYKKAISSKKNNIEACYNLASLYFFQENYVEASNLYKSILNIKSKHEEICENLAISLFKSGKKNELKDFILPIIAKYPDNKTLNNLLGQSLLALNSHKEGLSYIQKSAGFIQLNINGTKLLN